MDERLDDGLVGARGRESVHGGKVGAHECGPEADGQVFAGHQIDSVPLANPAGRENENNRVTHKGSI